VGFSRERPGKDGKVRHAALYRDVKGRQRSAGTFATERQADTSSRGRRDEAALQFARVRSSGFSALWVRRSLGSALRSWPGYPGAALRAFAERRLAALRPGPGCRISLYVAQALSLY
jgi:hypothetical protein